MSQSQSGAVEEFDAAKIIVEALVKFERPQQERILRFASEALGLKSSQSAESKHIEPASSRPHAVLPLVESRATDIKQFSAQKSPKSDQQFAAVVAYFYQFEAPQAERRETINAEVLANAARLVNRKRPTRHVLNNAKNSGYLDSVGGGEFRINTVGENLVAIALPGASGENGRVAAKKKKSLSKKSKTKKV